MKEFSNGQIEDAKKRVEQMRKKAQSYANNQNSNENNIENQSESIVNKTNVNTENNFNLPFKLDNIFKSLGIGSNDENSKGSGIILALILVLLYEKADSMLILALLYILL